MKRLLVVSPLFPPAGGVGVQRALSMARHLPSFGWEVEVVTLDARCARWSQRLDESLLVPPGLAVRHLTPRDPARTWRAAAQAGAAPTSSTTRLRRKGLRWMARALDAAALPDHQVWSFVSATIQSSAPIDAVWSTGPPHSAHVLGARFSRRYGVPWVMDYRDPWEPYVAQAARPRWRMPLEHALEDSLVRRADAVTTTTRMLGEHVLARQPDARARLSVIPNGVEPGELSTAAGTGTSAPGKLRIVHAGEVHTGRDVRPCLEALGKAVSSGGIDPERVELRLVGSTAPAWRIDEVVQACGLRDVVFRSGFVSRAKALTEMSEAGLLLLVGASGPLARLTVPAKTYEYLSLGRPILGLVQPGEARRLLVSHGCDLLAEPGDATSIERVLSEAFSRWRRGELRPARLLSDPRYLRREQAGQLATLLDGLVAPAG